MPPETEKLPFWHRPIQTPRILQSKIFWRVLRISALAGLILLVASPWLYGWTVWRMHPAVMYRGVAFPMPRGWITGEGHGYIEIEKPSSLLTGKPYLLPTSMAIFPHDLGDKSPGEVISRFQQMHRLIDPSAKFADFWEKDSQGNPSRIMCVRSRVEIGLQCISMDANWTFSCTCKLSDIPDAMKIMQTFVALEVPPPPANKSAPPSPPVTPPAPTGAQSHL